MKKKNKLFILLLFTNLILMAQDIELYKANIVNNHTKGFKVVKLTPNIRSIANSDLSDIRILDKDKIQIPYFIQEKSYQEEVTFIPLKNQLFFKKKTTEAIITNKEKKSFQDITLKVSNADVIKSCKIEGSEHLKQWFVISENIQFTLDNNAIKAYNFYNIHFPIIDYQYIKLTINDSLSAPINIKDIGYFNRKVIQKEDSFKKLDYTYNLTQKDKSTIIHVTASSAFEINKISFDIIAPEMFKRNTKIYTIHKQKEKEVKHYLNSFVLNSNEENVFTNVNITKKDFFIEIINNDNQPLKINEVNFAQKEKFLVFNLKPNQTYQIIAGGKKLKKPSYDLINFKNKIETNLPILNINSETFYIPENNEIKPKKAFYEQAWFMWISIGLVAVLILFFTLSLIKQTKEM